MRKNPQEIQGHLSGIYHIKFNYQIKACFLRIEATNLPNIAK